MSSVAFSGLAKKKVQAMFKQELLKTECSSLCAIAAAQTAVGVGCTPGWWSAVQCPQEAEEEQQQAGTPEHKMQTRKPPTEPAHASQDNLSVCCHIITESDALSRCCLHCEQKLGPKWQKYNY